MAIKPKDIYDGRKKKRSWGTIITVTVFVLIALVFILFYGLRARCVYDEDGNARIILPFSGEAETLREYKAAQRENQRENTPPPLSSAGTPTPQGEPDPDGTPQGESDPDGTPQGEPDPDGTPQGEPDPDGTEPIAPVPDVPEPAQ